MLILLEREVKVVEDYLEKYKDLDDSVTDRLPYELSPNITDTQKDNYKSIIEKQYLNFSYVIKDSDISEDSANIYVTFEVFDYIGTIEKATNYISLNTNEFVDDTGTVNDYNVTDYKLEQLEKCSDKQNVTIIFILNNNDGNWILNDISDNDLMKIQGLF